MTIISPICFARSDSLNLRVFGSPFGSLLESLFDIVGKKDELGVRRRGSNKKHRSFMKKRSHPGDATVWREGGVGHTQGAADRADTGCLQTAI